MKKLNLLFFAPLLLIASAVSSSAQQPQPLTNAAEPSKPPHQAARRPNLLQFLGLTPEQVQQIRAINQETRTQAREANQRQRQARRALDEAIYADALNQAEVEQRTQEFVEAQTAAVKLRSQVELRIRQVLTPDQLVRFRELRQRAEQNLQNWRQRFQERRQNKL